MKVISFCLYGTGGMYEQGLLENLRRIPVIYPDWQAQVFTDGRMGPAYLKCCADLGAGVILREPRRDAGGMFWRFEAVGDPRYEAAIVRDADSLVNERERVAVDAWLASPAKLHTMHDSNDHWGGPWPLLGGMWGAKIGAFPHDFPNLVRWWLKHKGPFPYAADQWFLQRYVWPFVMRSGMIHTSNVNSRHRGLPFPPHPPVYWHVGERMTPQKLSGLNKAKLLTKPKPPPLPHGFAA